MKPLHASVLRYWDFLVMSSKDNNLVVITLVTTCWEKLQIPNKGQVASKGGGHLGVSLCCFFFLDQLEDAL